jgi:hypothetical protein
MRLMRSWSIQGTNYLLRGDRSGQDVRGYVVAQYVLATLPHAPPPTTTKKDGGNMIFQRTSVRIFPIVMLNTNRPQNDEYESMTSLRQTRPYTKLP